MLSLLIVAVDLGTELQRVLLQHLFFLFLDATLLLLNLLLLLDDAEEFVALLLSLLS